MDEVFRMQVLDAIQNLEAQHSHCLYTESFALLLQQVLQTFTQKIQQHYIVSSLNAKSMHLGQNSVTLENPFWGSLFSSWQSFAQQHSCGCLADVSSSFAANFSVSLCMLTARQMSPKVPFPSFRISRQFLHTIVPDLRDPVPYTFGLICQNNGNQQHPIFINPNSIRQPYSRLIPGFWRRTKTRTWNHIILDMFLIRVLKTTLLLALAAALKPILENIPSAATSAADFVDEPRSLPLKSVIELNVSGESSQFGEVLLLQRKVPIDGNLTDDYLSNPSFYAPCTFCNMREPSYKLEFITNYTFEKLDIVSYAIDVDEGRLFLLTNTSALLCAFFQMSDKNINIKGEAKTLLTLDTLASPKITIHYVKVMKMLYLFADSQSRIFAVDPNSDEPKPVPLAGIKDISTSANATIRWFGLTFQILLKPKTLKMYFLTDKFECTEIQTIQTYENTQVYIADAMMVGSQLWILDEEFGLYTYIYKDQKYKQNEAYSIPYGKKLFIKRTETTIVIVFELFKETYIAELFLNSTTKQLALNRFYDQIQGVQDITFQDELMMVTGQIQTMIVRHSTNQYVLLNKIWQYKTFYGSYGLVGIVPLDYVPPAGDTPGVFPPLDITYFLIVKKSKIQFLNLTKKGSLISCTPTDPKNIGSHSIYLLVNTTLLNDTSVSIDRFYTIRRSIHLNVTGQMLSKKQVKSLSLSILSLLGLAGILILVAYTRHLKRKRMELKKLKQALRQKMVEMQKNKMIEIGNAQPNSHSTD